jgi:hypothetical protein
VVGEGQPQVGDLACGSAHAVGDTQTTTPTHLVDARQRVQHNRILAQELECAAVNDVLAACLCVVTRVM